VAARNIMLGYAPLAKCMRMQDVLPPPYTWPVPEKIGVKSVNEDKKSVVRDFSATRNSNALE